MKTTVRVLLPFMLASGTALAQPGTTPPPDDPSMTTPTPEDPIEGDLAVVVRAANGGVAWRVWSIRAE